MKITYRTADGRMSLEFEASSQQQVWSELAGFQEVFEAATKCGVCGCKYPLYVVRLNVGCSFYELHCRNEACRARKSFSVNKGTAGTLYPQRKDKEGNRLPCNGWIKWEGAKGDQ